MPKVPHLGVWALAAFTLVLPMTLLVLFGVVLFGVVLVVLSYREVVSVYTKAGGSYVVARENFGPRVAQVAAAALLVISVAAILAMCLGNLRGIREAGRIFAVPVSNAVSALRPPEGRHARQILATQGSIVAVLIAGISWLAHATHAIPHTAGFPTVLAQEAGVVFGHSPAGQLMFFILQAATAAILFTGGNTSFTGFPFLASFVAEDSFLPRWLTRRGHRLVFSNGIILLAALSLILMVIAGATVDALIPFYAIGVFTGFAMAGFGMARYHRRTREPGWRRRLVINVAGGSYTALVVVLFAVVKFTEGAWLIVIIFPGLVYALIRLNGEYRKEAVILADGDHHPVRRQAHGRDGARQALPGGHGRHPGLRASGPTA